MPNQKLVDYILIKLAKGQDLVKVRDSLTDLGWKHEELDLAINTAIKQRKTGKPMGVIQRAILLLKSPYHFFTGIKPEPGFKRPMLFLVFFSILLSLSFILRWAVFNFRIRQAYGYAVLGLSPLIIILGLAIVIFFTFIFSFISHIFLKIFHGGFSFPFTYKVCTYSFLPLMLSFFFFSTELFGILVLPLLVWSMMLTGYGMSEINELPIYQGIVAAILSYGLLIAAAALFIIIVFKDINLILQYFF